jgi:hypothetical protein
MDKDIAKRGAVKRSKQSRFVSRAFGHRDLRKTMQNEE